MLGAYRIEYTECMKLDHKTCAMSIDYAMHKKLLIFYKLGFGQHAFRSSALFSLLHMTIKLTTLLQCGLFNKNNAVSRTYSSILDQKDERLEEH